MNENVDKPSLKDIANADPATSNLEEGAVADAVVEGGEKSASSNTMVWVVMALVILGGGAAAGWSYLGPQVEPVVADLRALLGLTPRPTAPRLPSEQRPEVAPTVEVEPAPAEAVAPTTEEATAPMPIEQTPTAETAPPTVVPSDALAARIDAMQSELDALGKMFGPESQSNLDAIGGLVRALDDVNRELVNLSNRLQAVEDGSRADPTAPAQALVLGMTQLRSRLLGDGPFAAELTALEQIAAGDAAVQAAVSRLRPHADVGIPTEAVLTARFDKVAKAIVAARTTTDAGGWLGAVKDRLGGLVTVRRTDPAQITDAVERAVAVAEAALELGELAEAVEALAALQGAPAEAAAAWLGDASARVSAEAALEELHRHALSVLSAAGGAQKGN